MSTMAGTYTEEMVQVGFGQVHLMKGGAGKPLLLFQDDIGSPGWLPFYDALAQRFTVYVPEHPGFGHSERPEWMRSVRDMAFSPPGYSSAASRKMRAQTQVGRRADPFEKQLAEKNIICGTPDEVIASLRAILEETRPSILALWGNDGKVSHQDSMDCIRLMGQEVMPALREIGEELGLNSPFDLDTPVSLAQTPEHKLHPVGV